MSVILFAGASQLAASDLIARGTAVPVHRFQRETGMTGRLGYSLGTAWRHL